MRRAQKIALLAVLVALSGVGAYIKVPSPTGTVAFDSFPGYTAAIVLGATWGGLVAAVGHLISAMTVGFPLGLLHVAIAVGMAVAAVIFWACWKLHPAVGVVAATVFNGVVLPLVVVPLFGWGAYMAILPSLIVASLANVVVASVAGGSLRRALRSEAGDRWV